MQVKFHAAVGILGAITCGVFAMLDNPAGAVFGQTMVIVGLAGIFMNTNK